MSKTLLLLLIIPFFSCINNQSKNQDEVQTENSKNEVYTLPKELQEISGLTFITDSLVAAVEDEHGTLYFYDLNKEKIVRKYIFADDGDYEDLVKVKHAIYVVKANGTIYQIDKFADEHPQVTHYKTAFSKKNDIESITYDQKNNRLLLAVKEKNLNKNDDADEMKYIYEFSLTTKKLNETPVFVIKTADLEKAFKGDKLLEASKHFLKAAGNKNLNEIIKPTALAYHPINGNLYVLSSMNNFLTVLTPNGTFVEVIPLSGGEFTQPEGLAFNSKGEIK